MIVEEDWIFGSESSIQGVEFSAFVWQELITLGVLLKFLILSLEMEISHHRL